MQNALILGLSWPSLETFRDWVIVVYGLMGIIAFFLVIVILLLMIWMLRGVRGSVRSLIEDPIRPTLDEVRKTAQNIRGTSEFVADSAIHPVIRTVSAVRGIRRGIASIAGIRPRRR
ncbi:MAG: hypothetical protein O3A10_05645 [Chloroflexi bacterium]|nr:hypothetical protein [Chloroflexota bacterium]MDA1146162.1 hypothetical protein [Chloroflexota bacterium]